MEGRSHCTWSRRRLDSLGFSGGFTSLETVKVEELGLVYSLSRLLGNCSTRYFCTESYEVGFHHQLVFLVRKLTVCVWFDALDSLGVCFKFDWFFSDFRWFALRFYFVFMCSS